jgi:hypothetical protein
VKDPEGIKTIPWGLSEKNLLDLTPINSPLSFLEQDKIKHKKIVINKLLLIIINKVESKVVP